jgi:hypothetical protein
MAAADAAATVTGAWSDAEMHALIRLVNEGHTALECALLLGRRYGCVADRINVRNLRRCDEYMGPRNNCVYSEEDDEILMDMWTKGAPIGDIAKTLRRSVAGIQAHAKEMRMPKRNKK